MLRREVAHLRPALAASLLIVVATIAGNVQAQQPRLVITATESPERLSAHERYLLNEIDWVAQLQSELQQSRSVQVLSRDRKDLQMILEEKRLADSSLASGSGSQQFGLQVSDSLLRPSVTRFDVHTSYRPVELLDDVFERVDTATYEFRVEILAADGVEKFTKDVAGSYTWSTLEETLEEKRQGRYRSAAPLRTRTDAAVAEIVSSISTRINPISVVDVHPDYFVIDRGADAGLSEGDRFRVFAESKIVELANGSKKRIPGIAVGEAVITEIHDDIAFAKFMTGSGEEVAIKAGYTLRVTGENR